MSSLPESLYVLTGQTSPMRQSSHSILHKHIAQPTLYLVKALNYTQEEISGSPKNMCVLETWDSMFSLPKFSSEYSSMPLAQPLALETHNQRFITLPHHVSLQTVLIHRYLRSPPPPCCFSTDVMFTVDSNDAYSGGGSQIRETSRRLKEFIEQGVFVI